MQFRDSFLESGEEGLRAAGSRLLPHSTALLRAWKQREPWCSLSPAVSGPLVRLLDPALLLLASENQSRMREQVDYLARRLAKLKVPLELVLTALDDFLTLTRDQQPGIFRGVDEGGPALERHAYALVALVARSYDQVQRGALETLLGVLDAELWSEGLGELLPRLLQRAAAAFSAPWAEVLLLEEGGDAPRLRSRARYGVPEAMPVDERAPGRFFQEVTRTRAPGFLQEAADDPRAGQLWLRAVEAKSLWAAPLGGRDGAAPLLGVLLVAFERQYECLPQELDLLVALAERSTLAIERTRLSESLRQKERRVVDLSRQLLAAQEEERRRISRDLHDETGQAFMVLRLYLEMTLRQPLPAVARASLQRGLEVVDGSIAGLRRIMRRLSPLVLDELGLTAALRQQLRQLRRSAGVTFRFRATPAQFRLSRELEALIFRVVQEGLNNVARHAQATHVTLSIRQGRSRLRLRLTDNGRGLTALPEENGEAHFGLAGMRDRLRLVGGTLSVNSTLGRGTRLEIEIPLPPQAAGREER